LIKSGFSGFPGLRGLSRWALYLLGLKWQWCCWYFNKIPISWWRYKICKNCLYAIWTYCACW